MAHPFHFEAKSIGRTTHGPGQLRESLEYILRDKALVQAFGRHIPLDRDQAADWASWYVDPHRADALRANARVCDTWNAALPNGLTAENHGRIVLSFMSKTTGGRQDEIPWAIAVHRGLEEAEDPAERNDHVHGILVDRTVVKVGRKRSIIGMSDRPDALDHLRRCWEEAVNEELARLGRAEERIDSRTLLAQRVEAIIQGDAVRAVALDRRPTIHVGGAGKGKAQRGEATVTRDDYGHLDEGRSRAAANAERLAEREMARARAAKLAKATEEERLRALADQADAALERVSPLYGPMLARIGGDQVKQALAAVRERALDQLAALAIPIPTPARTPALPAAATAAPAAVVAPSSASPSIPVSTSQVSRPVLLRPLAPPHLGRRMQPIAPVVLSRAMQPVLPAQSPVPDPWLRRQARAVVAYIRSFEADMKRRAAEFTATAAQKITNVIAYAANKRSR